MFLTKFHVEKLKDKVFKILYLFEDKNEGLPTYIHSTIYEFEGLRHRVNPVQESMLLTTISVLEHIYDDSLSPDPDLEVIKREIFGLVSLLDKLYKHGDT